MLSININGRTRDIPEILLSEIIFGSSYFKSLLEGNFIKGEKYLHEFEGVSSESVQIFFDFIQDQTRFINPKIFYNNTMNTKSQKLYELLIILDYFNSNLSELIYESFENMGLQMLKNVEQVEIYSHINKRLNDIISEKIESSCTFLNTEQVSMYNLRVNVTDLHKYKLNLETFDIFIERNSDSPFIGYLTDEEIMDDEQDWLVYDLGEYKIIHGFVYAFTNPCSTENLFITNKNYEILMCVRDGITTPKYILEKVKDPMLCFIYNWYQEVTCHMTEYSSLHFTLPPYFV